MQNRRAGGAASTAAGPGIEAAAHKLAGELRECQDADDRGFWAGGFVRIPNAFWDGGFVSRMRPAEISLFLAIFRLSSVRGGPRPIQARAAELCRVGGISPRAFWSALRKLEEGKLIESRLSGKTYGIRVQPPVDWNLAAFEGRAGVLYRHTTQNIQA
jgi:hypothetical protein